jgi:para-nitrobenzyl esterase
VTPWDQPRLTIAQANICTQLHVISFLEIGSEDCLYLDVYVPPGMPANAKLPVMVWIYGGGYTVGDDWEFTLYDAQNLVKRSDVIIVAPNYRLGAFGFLSNPDLKAEDSKGSTGNYGLQDQNLALQWVQQNIANFGGDPSRVTIFGESAGAFSVCWHLVSPLSTGLFTAAIMESGTCDSTQFFQEPKISFSYSESWMGMSHICFSNCSSWVHFYHGMHSVHWL